MDENKAENIVENLISLIRVFQLLRTNEDGICGKPFPLDPTYWTLVFLLKEDLTMSELGRRLYRSQPNMTAIINKLIASGQVSRNPDPKDRRIVRITLTTTGRDFILAEKGKMMSTLKKNLAGLSGPDLAELSHELETVNSIISKLGKSIYE